MRDTWHTFETKVPHHEYDDMAITIEANRYGEDSPLITIDVNDGVSNRVTVTLDELRELVRLGDRFETAHRNLKGEEI